MFVYVDEKLLNCFPKWLYRNSDFSQKSSKHYMDQAEHTRRPGAKLDPGAAGFKTES